MGRRGKIKTVDVKMYKAKVFYFIGWEADAFRNYVFTKYKYDLVSLDGYSGLNLNFHGVQLIWSQKRYIKTLVHETIHAACGILDYVGVNYGSCKDSESLAYLVDFLLDNIGYGKN